MFKSHMLWLDYVCLYVCSQDKNRAQDMWYLMHLHSLGGHFEYIKVTEVTTKHTVSPLQRKKQYQETPSC